jgi:hypothetical protein
METKRIAEQDKMEKNAILRENILSFQEICGSIDENIAHYCSILFSGIIAYT